jgi:hypothetical protein
MVAAPELLSGLNAEQLRELGVLRKTWTGLCRNA